MNPGQIDREEDRRVKRMLAEAKQKRATVRFSKEKVRRFGVGTDTISGRQRYGGLTVGNFSLGFSSPAALGDAVMSKLKRREEFMSQHGPVRVLWKNGKPVDNPDGPA